MQFKDVGRENYYLNGIWKSVPVYVPDVTSKVMILLVVCSAMYKVFSYLATLVG